MKIIHRNNQFHYSLCGKECKPDKMTVVDECVNCEDCLKKLSEIKYTDTKTKIITKMKKQNAN